jgi:monomeric isocitrate dehydrogenase
MTQNQKLFTLTDEVTHTYSFLPIVQAFTQQQVEKTKDTLYCQNFIHFLFK